MAFACPSILGLAFDSCCTVGVESHMVSCAIHILNTYRCSAFFERITETENLAGRVSVECGLDRGLGFLWLVCDGSLSEPRTEAYHLR